MLKWSYNRKCHQKQLLMIGEKQEIYLKAYYTTYKSIIRSIDKLKPP
jgi:hypothetical protein